MYRVTPLVGIAALAASSFAQQPNTSPGSNPDTYPRDTYSQPVNGTPAPSGYGNWGLLGLFGLTGLLGLRRRRVETRETIVQGRAEQGRDEFVDAQRRRAS